MLYDIWDGRFARSVSESCELVIVFGVPVAIDGMGGMLFDNF
jgi:hypothetical protein